MLVAQSCLTLWDPMDYIAHQAPLSMGFSRQEYWSGLPLPSPYVFMVMGDLGPAQEEVWFPGDKLSL